VGPVQVAHRSGLLAGVPCRGALFDKDEPIFWQAIAGRIVMPHCFAWTRLGSSTLSSNS